MTKSETTRPIDIYTTRPIDIYTTRPIDIYTTRPIEIYMVINHKVGVTLPDTAANYKRDAITKCLKKGNKTRRKTWAMLRRNGFSCEKFVCQKWSIEL